MNESMIKSKKEGREGGSETSCDTVSTEHEIHRWSLNVDQHCWSDRTCVPHSTNQHLIVTAKTSVPYEYCKNLI